MVWNATGRRKVGFGQDGDIRPRVARLILLCVPALIFGAIALGGCKKTDVSATSDASSPSTISTETDAPHDDGPTAANVINATSGQYITVEGTLRRIEQTRDQTGMGWSRVVYLIELDAGTSISYTDGDGDNAQHSMESIAVETVEQYGDEADRNLESATSRHWQQYVGRRVMASGILYDTGNAHTYGFAMLDVRGVKPLT